MKVGIMQPYLFPYLGYFQLINAVDTFIIYDDVNYIKQGYINRNNVLVDGEAKRFTVPVPGASSFLKINELQFSNDVEKVLKTIQQAYSKKPYFNDIYPLVERVLLSPERSIPQMCLRAFTEIFSWLDLAPKIRLSSELNYPRPDGAAEKVINLCLAVGGKQYINSIGGRHLYQQALFASHGLDLSFLKMQEIVYPQGNHPFQPNLSIIDVLMHCSADDIKAHLMRYELL